jgi:hypothetical protein
MKENPMKHRFVTVVASVSLAVAFGFAPVAAAPPVTTTIHEKGLVETFPDVVPSCDNSGAVYEITTTSNFVSHETLFDDGRVHATFTQTGTFVATEPSLPDYAGKFTIWGNFNLNGKTVNSTFTFTVHGSGDDGSTFKNHVTEHFNERPDGSVNEFFHCH